MIMGDRGTGKSTTIRALADLLPEIRVVDKDPFNSGEGPAWRGTQQHFNEGLRPALYDNSCRPWVLSCRTCCAVVVADRACPALCR